MTPPRHAATPFPKPEDISQGPAEDGGQGPATFPLDVFPASAQRFAESAARALPVPLDLVTLPMLVTAGAAIGLSRVALHKGDHLEHAALIGTIVASPGHKKSPTLSLVTAPVWEREMEEHITWQRALAAAKQGENASVAPPRRHFALTDATMEAIAEVLNANPRGFLLHQDELSGWVRGMDQYRPRGKGTDLQSWLKIYSGVPWTVKRARKEPMHVARPFVAVLGGIQPDVLHELNTGKADGFLDRVLFAFPAAQPFQTSREDVPDGHRGGWGRLVRTLYGLEAGNDGSPLSLTLTDDAREVFFEWHEALFARARGGDVPERLHGVYGKAEGQALRFALILELMAWADGESSTQGAKISVESVINAGRLFDYFLDHQHRARTHLGGDPDERRAAALMEWMQRKNRRRVSVREVQSSEVAGIKRAKDVHHLFEIAADLGLGRRISIPRAGGQSSHGFEMAP